MPFGFGRPPRRNRGPGGRGRGYNRPPPPPPPPPRRYRRPYYRAGRGFGCATLLFMVLGLVAVAAVWLLA